MVPVKRNMNPIVVLLLVLVGASFLVVMGYAVHRIAVGFDDYNPDGLSEVQSTYMRDVRRRNVVDLEHMVGGGHRRMESSYYARNAAATPA